MKYNKILCGDAASLLPRFKNQVDLVVTSPPYDSLRKYGGHAFNSKKIIAELFNAVRAGGIVVWVVGDETKNGSESGTSFKHALMFLEAGFKLHDTMIFEKNTSSFPARRCGNRYTQIFEYMFIFSKGKPKTANLICDKENKWAGWTNWGTQTKRNKNDELVVRPDMNPVPKYSPRNNIWKYSVGGGFGNKDKRAHKHPATFPIQLAIDHILTWSNPGDLVMDPMCGSGTTCIAANDLKRGFIGIDVNEAYCALSKERLKI